MFVQYNFLRQKVWISHVNLLADQIHNSLSGLVLLSLCVHVDEVEVDIRQEARAVVDPLDGVTQRPGDGPALSANIT